MAMEIVIGDAPIKTKERNYGLASFFGWPAFTPVFNDLGIRQNRGLKETPALSEHISILVGAYPLVLVAFKKSSMFVR